MYRRKKIRDEQTTQYHGRRDVSKWENDGQNIPKITVNRI